MQVNRTVSAEYAQAKVIKMYGTALEDFYKTGNILSLAHMHKLYKALNSHIHTRALARKLRLIAYNEFGIVIRPDSYHVVKDSFRFDNIERQSDYIEVLKAGILEIK